jgi:hypothetical protein
MQIQLTPVSLLTTVVVAAILGGVAFGGIFTIVPAGSVPFAFRVNKFSGTVEACNAQRCWTPPQKTE